MDYALGELGFLQFEQLITELFALEARVSADAWIGEADRLRSVSHEAPIGEPLLSRVVAPPVLVQCAWIRPDRESLSAAAAMVQLVRPGTEEWERAGSMVFVTNLDLSGVDGLPEVGASAKDVALLGGTQIGARIDALPQLRRRMPSLLGLRDLDALIAPEAGQRSSLDRGAAQSLAPIFVPTSAYRRALAVLERHRFTVLTGPPEMGKTAIARMIGLAQLTAGWEAHECMRPEDIWAAFDRERAQVFIADDAFGSTEYRPDLAERWARDMERVLRALDDRHWLIWTSRPAPLRAALARLHRERGAERFPAPVDVLVDASALDVSEKTLILFRHARAASLSDVARNEIRAHGVEIVMHQYFTPERIRRLVAALDGSISDRRLGLRELVERELSRPTDAMAASFAALGDEHRDLLIAMLDSPPGSVSDHDLAAALRRHHRGALSRSPLELVDRMTDHFLRVLR